MTLKESIKAEAERRYDEWVGTKCSGISAREAATESAIWAMQHILSKIDGREWTVFDGHSDCPNISGPAIAYAENIKVIESSSIEKLKKEVGEL